MKIGIDIGGTNLAGGVVNDKGQVVIIDSIPTQAQEGYAAVLKRIITLVEKLKEAAKEEFPEESITAVGCGVPGICKNGVVLNAPNIFWKNEPLAKDLSEAVGLPVTLINDATAAAVAENRFGASKGTKDAVTYTLGTGVGGGVIVNGHVVNGKHGVASEFGHTLHGPNFYTCNCGKDGCLETYASATGLIKRHKHEVENGVESSVNPENSNAKDIIDAAREGDEASVIAFETLTDKLAESISNMIDILDPEIFVIGGGVAHAGDFLFDNITEKVKKNLTFPELVDVNIVPAQFGNDAGIIGAAYSDEYI